MSELEMEMGLKKEAPAERPENLSELLRHMSDRAGEKITLGEIADAMADRSFGAFLVVFCLPNLIPLPPGATFVLGLPLIFIAFQIAFSRLDTVWLPRRLHDFAFDNRAFRSMLDRVLPYMEKAERLIRPRYWPERTRLFERFIGVFALILGIIVFLPIPFGNLGPSYALALIGLGLTERDGIVVGIGLIVGAAISAVVAYVGYELVHLVPYFFLQIPNYWYGFRNFVFG